MTALYARPTRSECALRTTGSTLYSLGCTPMPSTFRRPLRSRPEVYSLTGNAMTETWTTHLSLDVDATYPNLVEYIMKLIYHDIENAICVLSEPLLPGCRALPVSRARRSGRTQAPCGLAPIPSSGDPTCSIGYSGAGRAAQRPPEGSWTQTVTGVLNLATSFPTCPSSLLPTHARTNCIRRIWSLSQRSGEELAFRKLSRSMKAE